MLLAGSVAGGIGAAALGLFEWKPAGSGAFLFVPWLLGLLNLAKWAAGERVRPGSPTRRGQPTVFHPGRAAAGALTGVAAGAATAVGVESVADPYSAHVAAAGVSLIGLLALSRFATERVRP